MIRTDDDRWLHYEDLARQHPGRGDDSEVVEQCWAYLHAERGGRGPVAHVEAKTASELLAAKLRASAASGAGSNLALAARLAAQETTINRLLAFVPARAQEIAADRMQAITGNILDAATEIFTNRRIAAASIRETDTDTSACHRIVLRVEIREDDDFAALARSEFILQRTLAEVLPDEEFQAIRLLLEPAPAS